MGTGRLKYVAVKIVDRTIVRLYVMLRFVRRACLHDVLTHLSLVSFLWDIGNSIAPDVTPQNAASHLGLFCLLREFSSKN